MPGRVFREGDRTTLYWIRGDEVLYRHYPVRGADIESFRFYLGSFAEDRKHCYCTSSKDDARVYYLNRHIKEAHCESFEVVPSELLQLAKDKHHYYWNDRIVEQNEFEKLLQDELGQSK